MPNQISLAVTKVLRAMLPASTNLANIGVARSHPFVRSSRPPFKRISVKVRGLAVPALPNYRRAVHFTTRPEVRCN